MTFPDQQQAQQTAVCYRHAKRPTAVRCSSCERPICADCMRSTPVGFRCPDCAPTSNFVLADDLLVTKVIVALNVIVFLVGVVIQVSNGVSVGITGSSGRDELLTNGGLAALPVADGEWWRVFTSGFLHAGLLHIGLNMFFVYSFGGLLEPALGRVRYALLYAVGILGGAIGALALSSANVLTVGASGAGFSLLGAALVMARLRGHSELESNLLTIAAINFGFTFIASGISVGGHLGGFVAGLLTGILAYGPLRRQPQALTAIYAGLTVALFAVALFVAHAKADTFIATFSG
ncbi:MAG: rhomboid family intramembrane serine protease [Patulibacter sp.]